MDFESDVAYWYDSDVSCGFGDGVPCVNCRSWYGRLVGDGDSDVSGGEECILSLCDQCVRLDCYEPYLIQDIPWIAAEEDARN